MSLFRDSPVFLTEFKLKLKKNAFYLFLPLLIIGASVF
ncbi:hypothetical protein DSM3645_06354 [Blastopirellula marina DSM 3645]|uniref:Uncharacterized protein n=1 Tax=Blastopirellula marina DSM 3645 TaxID=314230 RepID=A4A2P6_9BACT|nr:hypothetical protein DSM3645_06354 [Blastopirellula marina DSM 3645]